MGKGLKQTFLQRKYTNSQQVHRKMLKVISQDGNANQNNEIPLIPTRMTILKKTNVGEAAEESEPPLIQW